MSSAESALSALKKIAEIAEKHPDAVAAIDEIATAVLKGKKPTEIANTARRAALAAAAEEFIDS